MMANPNLLFPVTISISPIDRVNTIRDDSRREPVLLTARSATAISISAQVQWTERGRREADQTGRLKKGNGYLIVLQRDLTSRSYVPDVGDKITSIPGETDGPWYLHSFEPCMHKRGRSQGLLLRFKDHMPAKTGG